MDNQSDKYTLNSEDYKKIAKGATIAFAGATLYSIATWLSNGSVNWNTFLTVAVPAALSVGINAAIKWISGPQQ